MLNKVIFILLTSFLLFGCTEKIDIIYQKDKNIRYKIDYKSLHSKSILIDNGRILISKLSNNKNSYKLDSRIKVYMNNKIILDGYLYLEPNLNNLDFYYIKDYNLTISCNDKYRFNEINYGFNEITCSLYKKEDIENKVSLKKAFDNLNENLIFKFIIK